MQIFNKKYFKKYLTFKITTIYIELHTANNTKKGDCCECETTGTDD